MRRVLLTIMAMTIAFAAQAQRERNYIYLLDCTQSMIQTTKIWDITKGYLKADIEEHVAPGSTVNVVPFQTGAFDPITFTREDFNWEEVEKTVDEYIKTRSNTGICNAWDMGTRLLDPAKDNYFFLLTDGEDNVAGMDAVCKRISQWCDKYQNSYGFYVMLCKEARNQSLQDAVEGCNRFTLVDADGHPKPVGTFYPHDIRVNTRTYQPKTLTFSDAASYEVEVKCADPLFTVKLDGGIQQGRAVLKVEPRLEKQQLAQALQGKISYVFEANITPKGNIELLDDKVVVEVINKPERSLSLADEEINMGKANYYDAFLFWGAKAPDTLRADLKAAFNDEALKEGSVVVMKSKLIKGDEGYTLYYNGKPCDDGTFEIRGGDQASEVSVIFNGDAADGKRYVELTPMKLKNLDNINDAAPSEYKITLRSNYDTDMNPLKLMLLWLLAIIAALLAVWFLMLKRLVYPTFREKHLYISEPIAKAVTLKGARRVVLSNKKQQQGMLSRLFSGRIEYVRGDAWATPIELAPGKRGPRIRLTNPYLIDPPASILQAAETYTIENDDTKEKTVLMVNK